jgi:hypothetical protein
MQEQADKRFDDELDDSGGALKGSEDQKPDRPRGYYSTDLTLEGLKSDHSGHGGKIVILDELSGFFTGQNQYKAVKGNDRETWLALHDGKPARVTRVRGSITLHNIRVNIFGGVQPSVWRRCFSGEENAIYLMDGTMFRFLATYEGNAFYSLTAESWSDENRKAWEKTLDLAMDWADAYFEEYGYNELQLLFAEDAQARFIDWRNEVALLAANLPQEIRGFIPKITGYAVRFAGLLNCLWQFEAFVEPGKFVKLADIDRGIAAANFYMGQIVHAAQALFHEDHQLPPELTPQVLHLIRTLRDLRGQLDSGRLAVGFIHQEFNNTCQPEEKIATPKAMGAFLRGCGLTISPGKHNANGRSSVKCLQWDEHSEKLIKRGSELNQVEQSDVG